MKKKISLLLVLVMLCVVFCALTACNKQVTEITFDGDIQGEVQAVNLAKIKQEKYSYDDDGTTVKAKGWPLSEVLKSITPKYDDNYLMITADDGVSVLIEYNLTAPVYLYENDEGKLCSKGLGYPRAVGIKNISEITVVAKNPEDVTEGFKVLTADKTDYVSRGNAKLKLFELSAPNEMNGNTADKYLPSDNATVAAFTQRDNNVAYFEDYDMLADVAYKTLSWKQGKMYLDNNGEKKAVFGFATNTTKTLMDFYGEMKDSIDNNQKVMFILPDGFSWQQCNEFSDSLSVLNSTRTSGYALSTHLSISPVALATIVTGQSPYKTGIHFAEDESRAVLKPNVPDIFDYAVSKNKSVKYIEGHGNLIVTNVKQIYSTSDRMVYENAKTAISSNADLIFVHFHEIDDVNHKYGALSNQSLNKCMEIDGYISDLAALFSGKIIIVPDHGHNTLYDANNVAYGKHGMFTNLDMYIPYYIL